MASVQFFFSLKNHSTLLYSLQPPPSTATVPNAQLLVQNDSYACTKGGEGGGGRSWPELQAIVPCLHNIIFYSGSPSVPSPPLLQKNVQFSIKKISLLGWFMIDKQF